MICRFQHNGMCCNCGSLHYQRTCKERRCPHIVPISNADRIRAMSDEELALLLLDGCRGSKCDDQPQNEWGSVNCFQCRMDWLKKPYKEEA